MNTTIPFDGFYCSVHSDVIDDAEEQMFADDNGTPNTGLSMALWRDCNYQGVHSLFVRDYCKNFGRWLKIDSLKFEALDSPREYNFTTDRIFATISEADVIKLFNSVPYETLKAKARERHTSRDGFISFYDPDILTWGPLDTWDHNQVGTLMEVAAEEESGSGSFDQWDQHDIVDRERVEGWIAECTPSAPRLYRIRDYLQTRAHRAGT